MPARNILASVGLGGANLTNDVVTIQSMLNNVPTGNGGPQPRLEPDGKCGPLTVGAIRKFQLAQFNSADGRVDVGQRTIERLQGFDQAPGAAPPAPAPPPGGITPPQIVTPPGHLPPTPQPPPTFTLPQGLSPLRRRILEIGMGEALPEPAVTDLKTVRDGNETVRAGWKRLKQYFDEGVEGWTEQKWKDKATYDGVRIPGRRIPQPNSDGVSWCGIFATWVVRSAGVETKWRMGAGPSKLKLNFSRNCRPGDIAVIAQNVHHFIVASPLADEIMTINGNSTNQSILVKPWPLSSVRYFYSVED
ncbi:peptidoglycan-binding domain-containing protein [Xenophilus arseniciresistens]|uniref:Peptidoglycan-binding domain-containing protein n=1 Tax=Xenophilus arseniciresistens TaxID=1283306 RepID=A0AAE3N4R9_9BURK|nr:peptidoglycan-binding domain-containing protein [Xenophilus arseniciresistens]MDA7415216.1 peptidoglycan-binding domain-containing protein [Xenophilus arseniciresistens]